MRILPINPPVPPTRDVSIFLTRVSFIWNLSISLDMMGWYYSQLFVTPPYPTKSFSEQTVIVTGSNVGLGYEAAQHFVRLGAAKVIIAVRNVAAGEKAKQSIEAAVQRTGVCEVWELDLASFSSVKAFGARAAQLPRLDIVVENAALAVSDFRLIEGHERQITINVISTILLALLLLPKIQETARRFPAAEGHITIVSSEVHAWTSFPEWKAPNTFAALNDAEKTNMAERYGTSKLLEILAVREIAPRIANSGVIINLVNPGLCHSALARHSGWGLWLLKQVFARSTEVGSRTLMAGATAGQDSHGAFMSDGHVANDELSAFVRSDEGLQAQKKVWRELGEILEQIYPGILNVLPS
ncbi:hypothetical protein BGW36DRAFT_366338 [Talaromyces proteolyticus]|uniref:Uncharacterized protein n=1 Tax=Talaromyces proteolyticus TaxID=1131652 RepID=A0AAD4Q0U4_9EURO|nr:uncharacterized protein BGW36DRAFT_366338 [Talaromyces proteolyticus]KAH8704875.1 hypothetical protein BGW36DRAFT_366338 [Talaromyces proteolyticus]